MIRNEDSPRPLRKFRLHPLIHTRLQFTLVQDIGSIESGAEAPQCFLGNRCVYAGDCCRFSDSLNRATSEAQLSLQYTLQKKYIPSSQ